MGHYLDQLFKQILERDRERAVETLEQYRSKYEGGDKIYLMNAIAFCMRVDVAPPGWVKSAFYRARLGEGPWESDLGERRQPKNWQRIHARDDKAMALFKRVEELRGESAVDTALFERVGGEFGVSEGTAREMYYSDRTRAMISDRSSDREIQELMIKEIGPDADEDTKELWWDRNSERIDEIMTRWDEWYKNPIRTRKKRKS